MAGRLMSGRVRQGTTTRTNWMALAAIVVLTVGVGIGWAGAVNENLYWCAFALIVTCAGAGCAVLSLGDDGS